MIEKVLRIPLRANFYSSLCYLTGYNDRYDSYITDVETVKAYLRAFVNDKDLEKANKNEVAYILFTKE